LTPTGLFGHGECLDEHLLVGRHVILGLLLALLQHLGVHHAEGDGVLEGFPEHVGVNIATLLYPPDLISDAVNSFQHLLHVLHFVALGHFRELA
jgi:hypothetical protein